MRPDGRPVALDFFRQHDGAAGEVDDKFQRVSPPLELPRPQVVPVQKEQIKRIEHGLVGRASSRLSESSLQRAEIRSARLVQNHCLAVNDGAVNRQRGHSLCDGGKTIGPVVAARVRIVTLPWSM